MSLNETSKLIIIIITNSNTPGKNEIKELQKTAILGTGQYCGSCDCQYRTLNMGNNITCSTYCNYRTVAILCTAGTLFGSVV
jgi:hypothetical protein